MLLQKGSLYFFFSKFVQKFKMTVLTYLGNFLDQITSFYKKRFFFTFFLEICPKDQNDVLDIFGKLSNSDHKLLQSEDLVKWLDLLQSTRLKS